MIGDTLQPRMGKYVKLSHWDRRIYLPWNKAITGSDDGISPVNWTIGEKFWYDLNRNLTLFIKLDGNVVGKIVAILWRPQICWSGCFEVNPIFSNNTKCQWLYIFV